MSAQSAAGSAVHVIAIYCAFLYSFLFIFFQTCIHPSVWGNCSLVFPSLRNKYRHHIISPQSFTPPFLSQVVVEQCSPQRVPQPFAELQKPPDRAWDKPHTQDVGCLGADLDRARFGHCLKGLKHLKRTGGNYDFLAQHSAPQTTSLWCNCGGYMAWHFEISLLTNGHAGTQRDLP